MKRRTLFSTRLYFSFTLAQVKRVNRISSFARSNSLSCLYNYHYRATRLVIERVHFSSTYFAHATSLNTDSHAFISRSSKVLIYPTWSNLFFYSIQEYWVIHGYFPPQSLPTNTCTDPMHSPFRRKKSHYCSSSWLTSSSLFYWRYFPTCSSHSTLLVLYLLQL